MYNMSKLKIAPFGMVSGSNFRERSIDDFFKWLAKEFNSVHFLVDDTLKYNVGYYVSVSKRSDDEQTIATYEICREGQQDFCIDTEGYPEIAKRLDEFCKITNERKEKANRYKNIDNIANFSPDEEVTALRDLKEARKNVLGVTIEKMAFIIASLACLPASIAGIIAFVIAAVAADTLTVLTGSMLLALIFTGCYGLSSLIDFFSNDENLIVDRRGASRYLKYLKNVKKKIEYLSKKIGERNAKAATPVKDDLTYLNTDTKQEYTDPLISEMHYTKEYAMQLDEENKTRILASLLQIVYLYWLKSREVETTEKMKAIRGEARLALGKLQEEIYGILHENDKTDETEGFIDTFEHNAMSVGAIEEMKEVKRRVLAQGK